LALSAQCSNNQLPYIPRSIKSIEKSPIPEKWTLILDNEIKLLVSQNVFDLTPLTISDNRIFNIQFSFDLRMNVDGSINTYKARFVAQRNFQDATNFLKYLQILSSRSINILLSIAAEESSHHISTIDIKTAFLYSL
jgi:hypothetical protein